MTPAKFLHTARTGGVTLWNEGGVLRYRAPREALARLVPVLKAHKPAILEALARESDEVEGLKELFEGCFRVLDDFVGASKEASQLEAGRVTATLARNRGYLWSSLRTVLAGHPALLAQIPDKAGPVDALPLGVATVAVLKDKNVVKQGVWQEVDLPRQRGAAAKYGEVGEVGVDA
jgi:hypothetical protein